jgi:L-threonylcarbamoyladenylate synthase
VTRTRTFDGGDPTAIAEAAQWLRSGKLVAIPTETVYGLGANALDDRAVARIFAAKERPAFDPLIVHVATPEAAWAMIDGEPPAAARRLANAFWPGPFTIVLPRGEQVSELVTSGLPDVAIRVPAHDVARAVIAAAGVPVAAPSANLFGRVSPTTADHVLAQLDGVIDAVLDGGPCRIGVESTVVRIVDGGVEILRHGGVTREQIEALGLRVHDGVRVLERPLAPGQLARHYATQTPLRLFEHDTLQRRAGDRSAPHDLLLVVAGAAPACAATWSEVVLLAPDGDLGEAAAALFATMRELDQRGVRCIDVLACPREGIGRAICDRLERAAATHGEHS